MGLPGLKENRGSEVEMKSIYVKPREQVVDWVRQQLIGPPAPMEDPEAPELELLPTERFPCGALYPVSDLGDGIDPTGEDLDDVNADLGGPEGSEEEGAVVRRYMPPSSIGFSFFISGSDAQLQISCSGASYEYIERDGKGHYKKGWKRKTLAGGGDEESIVDVRYPGESRRQQFKVFGGKGRLDVVWRPFSSGWIVTVSLCNERKMPDDRVDNYAVERAKRTLFESILKCRIDAGEVGTYPRVDRSLLDDEAQEVELQYSSRHIYAIGHGCAVDWILEQGEVREFASQAVPAVEVPQMTADTGASDDMVLSLGHLAGLEHPSEDDLIGLKAFVEGYGSWVADQVSRVDELSLEDRAAGERIVGRMGMSLLRMRAGVKLIETNDEARLAFALANRAMLDQMRQNDHLTGRQRDDSSYFWRPFQLAFLLTALESAENENSDFRDTVDLIWFPTGGGKTEAYLGLIAFQVLLRRLRYRESGAGTTVLMRYTLRLLTRDQFVRATRLIFALELIRRDRPDLGTSAISIGLWVGAATSPNSFKKAYEVVQKARKAGGKVAMVLDGCPWCGESFQADRNFRASDDRFHFLCCNKACRFGEAGGSVLPCNVVDEALYGDPPTMLVATIDKFARLAWEGRATAFFGRGGMRPPELIIQDELHLIAGALGSVAGLYEAGIDTVLQLKGVYPKYIASTATIRMAGEQVRRLYGRDVSVFPSPGLSCDDSFFARTVPLEQRPGRMYVGYLAPMLNRQKCMAPLAASLLLAPLTLFKGHEDEGAMLDAWWSQVVYHGSLKGVGNSHTAFLSDVRDVARAVDPGAMHQDRMSPMISQLTSLQTAEENAEIFSRLSRRCDEQGCIDAVLATNMISVGLDVGRLALMVINGQPLTTAEYIQASSRVGRSEVPGLVFANYYRDQARSLSHYEGFRPYHEAFYRFVEPTSVTPYAYQARLRALHAALVIAVRHTIVGLSGNDKAGSFDAASDGVVKVVAKLKRRCRLSGHGASESIGDHIDAVINEWSTEVDRCRGARRALHYQVPDSDASRDRLLHNHGDRIKGLWPTLQSMRNVENTALLKVI